MEGKVRSFPCTTARKYSLLLPIPCFSVHINLLQLSTGQSPARQFTETPWPGRRPANSRHFPATQLYRWPKQQFASALHHQSVSSEESQHLSSPHSASLPVPARSPQTDTDVVSPPSKLEAVVAQRRPQSGKDSLGGGSSRCCDHTAPSQRSRPVCPQAAASTPSLSRCPFWLTHSCWAQILFSCHSPTLCGWVSPEIC